MMVAFGYAGLAQADGTVVSILFGAVSFAVGCIGGCLDLQRGESRRANGDWGRQLIGKTKIDKFVAAQPKTVSRHTTRHAKPEPLARSRANSRDCDGAQMLRKPMFNPLSVEQSCRRNLSGDRRSLAHDSADRAANRRAEY